MLLAELGQQQYITILTIALICPAVQIPNVGCRGYITCYLD